MSTVEKNLEERVSKLEIIMDTVAKGIEEIKLEIRSLHQEIQALNTRMDVWLRWILGFVFSSWLSTMLSIWLKK
jgi:prophage DNA circulation protein